MSAAKPHPTLNLLQVTAVVAAAMAVVQLVLGLLLATTSAPVGHWHSGVGAIALVAGLAAAFYAIRWAKVSGNKGLMGHAISVGVLGLVQYALGELAHGAMVMVHMGVGVLFLLDAVALATLAFRKPGAPLPAA